MSKSSKPEATEDGVASERDTSVPQKPAEIDPGIQGVLGRKLRESYDALVNEEVPAKFRDLLLELKKKESSSKDGM